MPISSDRENLGSAGHSAGSVRPFRLAALAALAAAGGLLLTACGGSSGSTAASPAAETSATGSAVGVPPGTSAGVTTAAGTSGSSTGGSAASSSASSSAAGSAKVTITITAAKGCVTEPSTVPAGPVDFTIKNADATGVTEVHLVADQRIRGERENLAPGFSAGFSATLDGGAYEIYCPGADPTTTSFTVTGQSAAAPSDDVADLLHQATVDYATYVDGQAAYLVKATPALAAAIKSGDLKKAQEAYAAARPFYEKIEPVAESFGDLDPNIDARDGDVPAAEWRGFHQIEKALFVDKSTTKAQPFVKPLTPTSPSCRSWPSS